MILMKVCVLLTVISVNCEKSKFVCNRTEMDECFANFIILCNNTIKFPESKLELNAWCGDKRPKINKCVKDYTNKCVRSVHLRRNLKLFRRSLNNYYVDMCANEVDTDRRLSLSKCWNSLKPAFLRSCHSVFNEFMIDTIKLETTGSKIAHICCHYWEFLNCGSELIGKAADIGGNICDARHPNEFVRFNRHVSQTWAQICGDKYSAGSDKCSYLLSTHKPITHSGLNNEWRSAIPYIVDIFDSM